MEFNNLDSQLNGANTISAAEALKDEGKVITKERIIEAEQILSEYRRGKQNLDQRIVDNEQWYKLRHWPQMGRTEDQVASQIDPAPTSAWLLNTLTNKHADAMDNYPGINVLPREQEDERDAKMLSSIIPVILERNDYEQVYSDTWWYKLKTGTGVTGVFWDSSKNNGLGDIDIRKVDILNLFWEPGITNIQDSQNLFHVEYVDIDVLRDAYPDLEFGKSSIIQVTKYLYDDSIDMTDKLAVVDWYYKANRGGKNILHYCKFCAGQVIYASEDDPQYADRGFYDHGDYPFVFDTLFPTEGTPAGFGYIDICKSPQTYIDRLDEVLLRHSMMSAQPRFFVRQDGILEEKEYADWTKPFVHYNGSGDPRESIIPLEIPDVPSIVENIRLQKIDELKETTGNRDVNSGGASGITAASAIAALQEAGSKSSRDMIKSAYRAFQRVCYMVIELIRQFYTEPRMFRITGNDGSFTFEQFDGRTIAEKPLGTDFGQDMGYRVPIFDISVSAEKQSPFSQVAQNERAKELYQLGFFRPDLADQALAALDMMAFEGKDKVVARIQQNGTLYQQVQQLQAQMMQMAQIIDAQNGSTIGQQLAGQAAQAQQVPSGGTANTNGDAAQRQNPLDRQFNESMSSTAGKARARAAALSTPR